jgi:succinate dehydrogenase/fumarate reductase flavoprotein subunit
MNLEFKQIFLGTVYPTKNMLIMPLPPYTKLTNASGEEFLNSYLPEGVSLEDCLAQRHSHNPFSTRDTLSKYVDIAIIGEVKAGRATSYNGIYLDRSDPRVPPLQTERREFWDYRGIDWGKPVEVGVCHHCSLGGFRIDENAQTTMLRLYAAGETAAGPHGADRMGGHMLLATQVFGARAGKHGATYARNQGTPDIDNKVLRAAEERINALRNKKGKRKPAEVKRVLQQSAYYDLLVVKSKESLTKFLNEVKGIQEDLVPHLSAANPQELVEALELQNLLLLAEVEANVCLERTESRGPHYREDFPRQNDKDWLKSITVKNVNGKPQVGTIALDPNWKSRGDEKVKGWG